MKRSRECVPSLLHHRSTGACSASRRWVPKGRRDLERSLLDDDLDASGRAA
jgi:hypothetical protein